MIDVLTRVNDPKLMALIKEYVTLARLPELNDFQAKRFGEILEIATVDNVVDFLVCEVEHILGHELELLNMDAIEDTQALLRERLGTDIPICIDGSVCKDKEPVGSV